MVMASAYAGIFRGNFRGCMELPRSSPPASPHLCGWCRMTTAMHHPVHIWKKKLSWNGGKWDRPAGSCRFSAQLGAALICHDALLSFCWGADGSCQLSAVLSPEGNQEALAFLSGSGSFTYIYFCSLWSLCLCINVMHIDAEQKDHHHPAFLFMTFSYSESKKTKPVSRW